MQRGENFFTLDTTFEQYEYAVRYRKSKINSLSVIRNPFNFYVNGAPQVVTTVLASDGN